jgi:sugar/nucleoside kinase (ribokinase family)
MHSASKAFHEAPKPTIVGAGLLTLDIVLSDVSGAPPRMWTGGTCGNVLIALTYLGWNAEPVARLQPGAAADHIVTDMRRWGVSDKFVCIADDGSTPIIVQRITARTGGQPRHSFSWRCPFCGSYFPGFKSVLLSTAESIASKLEKPQVFFFDRVSPGILLLARTCAAKGALVVFEPSGVGNPVLFQQAWQVSHIVKYSHERLTELPHTIVQHDRGPVLEIETLGESGLRYRRRSHSTPFGWTEMAALSSLDFRDSAGAGDWCTAGFLFKAAAKGRTGFVGLSAGELHDSLRYGQALAAWACGYEGARGGMYSVTPKTFSRLVGKILRGQNPVISRLSITRMRHIDAMAAFCFTCKGSTQNRKRRSSSL